MPLHIKVVKSVLLLLKKAKDKDVFTHALGLLLVLFSKQSPAIFRIAFDFQSENENFSAAARRILLSKDSSLHICMAQCICCILSKATETKCYVGELLENNIPELLFELLATKSELLTESILCCLFRFSEHPAFFAKCHAIYGVEAILEATDNLLNAHDWKLSTLALGLLKVVFGSEHRSIFPTPQTAIFDKAIKLVERALKINNHPLLLTSLDFLAVLLKKEHLPWPLPLTSVLETFQLAMKAVSKFLCSVGNEAHMKELEMALITGNFPIDAIIIERGLQVVTSVSSLAVDHAANPVTLEDAFSCPALQIDGTITEKAIKEQSGGNLLEQAITALDEVFVPFVLRFRDSNTFGKTAGASLIICLYEIYNCHWKNSSELYGLTKKLLRCGFIKQILEIRNSQLAVVRDISILRMSCGCCLKFILWSYLENEESTNDSYFNAVEIGIEQLDDTLEHCLPIMSQRCDFTSLEHELTNVPSAQLTLLLLLYNLYFNLDYTVPPRSLLSHLTCFISMYTELSKLPAITLKHVSYLLAVCTCENFVKETQYHAELHEANMAVTNAMGSAASYEDVYTHDKLILWWCFILDKQNSFTTFVFQQWLSRSVEDEGQEELEAVFQLLCKNKFAQLTFMECLESDVLGRVVQASQFLKLARKQKVTESEDVSVSKLFAEFLRKIICHIPSGLVKYFLMKNETENPLDSKRVPILLECLGWCRKQIKGDNAQSDLNLKIIFYVSNFCSVKQEPQELINCLHYVETVISESLYSSDHRAWHVVTSNSNLMSLLEKCVVSELHELQYSSLNLLLTVLNYQIRHDVHGEAMVNLNLEALFRMLQSEKNVQMLVYKLLNGLLKTNFRRSILCIVTPGQMSLFEEYNSRLYLSPMDIRALFVYLQNAVVMKDPTSNEIAVSTFLNLMSFIGRRDSALEKHLIMQPWAKIMLTERLTSWKIFDENTWKLFAKWLSYDEVNPYLISTVQQFAEAVFAHERNALDVTQCDLIMKLCKGTYGSHLPSETQKNLLDLVSAEKLKNVSNSDKEVKLMNQVKKLVESCIGAVSILPDDCLQTNDSRTTAKNVAKNAVKMKMPKKKKRENVIH